MKTNQILGIAFVVLLGLSGWTYHDSVTRAERFERGQKFLPNLNPDEIIQIMITKGDGGEDGDGNDGDGNDGDGAHLRRQGDEFVMVNANGYPATNESVNRFIRDVLEMSLEKKIGSGESLEEELELEPAGTGTIRVVFKDKNEKDMVSFVIGKAADDGSGNFVTRKDGDDRTVYLTSKSSYLRTSDDDFLKKDIVDVKGEDIASITGADFTLSNEDGSLKLADLPAGMKESSTASSAKSILSSLRFTKHHLANASEVQRLFFDQVVQVGLNDDSSYQVALAESKQGDETKYYVRIQGAHKAQQLSIAPDDSEEVAKQTADTLQRLDELDKFNKFHGSWVYEISESAADKIKVKRSDLMEKA